MIISKPQQERFDKMCLMRDNGKTIMEIAEHFGITKQRVSQIFRYHDMPLRVDVPTDVVIQIADPKILAEQYGFQVDSMKARLRRLGFVLPRQPYTRSIWPKEKVMEMYQDYEAGMTQTEIAVKYDTDQSEVSRLFIDWGLKTRGRGWAKGKPRGKRQTEI